MRHGGEVVRGSAVKNSSLWKHGHEATKRAQSDGGTCTQAKPIQATFAVIPTTNTGVRHNQGIQRCVGVATGAACLALDLNRH